MKIIIVGASGTIGKKVTEALRGENEIITAGSKSGDIQVDITSSESIKAFYKQTGGFDALVSVTGSAHFGPLNTMTAKDFDIGLQNKLLGQVNLVLIGQHYINPKGSFTLTSGILSDDPIVLGANLSAVNGGINAFAKAAAIELENGVRINAISAGVVEDAPGYFPYFPGHIPVTMDKVANAYYKSVFGALTGQVIQVW
ncbi:NAD(P)-dependent dehydrogenase, short-chain alcohol dehydrogenase family [Mucilaginibacter sp. OK268]|uniref:short chain dehydrogenase n=1 Tax=Mucilaginibacter sp. OK268 TaxID=1881048 RepID=UPI000889541B|nr:short chain dehydrogenase [Mucilaginibacter sp. OK268]SDP74566.1 NAD(P)-dependent dehydrogenase, short-chain alcohol dehydrogenase family [Mucilaginibacter sp. OK268]